MTKEPPKIVPAGEVEFGESSAQADPLEETPAVQSAPLVITSAPLQLETVIGDLRSYSQLEPGTLLHADELMAQQVKNPVLREQGYYVADFALYTLEGTGKKKTPTLWLARHTPQEPNNLVLNHLDDVVHSSFDQLTQTHNYHSSSQEAQRVMQANSTLKIDLTLLRLKGNETEYRFIEIDTVNYNLLNLEERKLAERFYGQGTAFDTAMRTLKSAGIDTTKVYVLNPAYVQKEAVNPIGRAAWRINFRCSAGSGANGYYILDSLGLLGVRRRLSAAAGGAPQNTGVPSAPSAPQEMKLAMPEILRYCTPFIPDIVRQQFEDGLRKLYQK